MSYVRKIFEVIEVETFFLRMNLILLFLTNTLTKFLHLPGAAGAGYRLINYKDKDKGRTGLETVKRIQRETVHLQGQANWRCAKISPKCN